MHHTINADDVEACASDLIARSNLSQLPELLRKLPHERLRERFGLQLILAQLQLNANDFDEARSILQYLQDHRQRLSQVQQDTLLIQHDAGAMQLDDSEAAFLLMPQLQAISSELDDTAACGRASVEAEQHDRAAPNTAVIATGLLANALYEVNYLQETCLLLKPRIEVLESTALPGIVLLTSFWSDQDLLADRPPAGSPGPPGPNRGAWPALRAQSSCRVAVTAWRRTHRFRHPTCAMHRQRWMCRCSPWVMYM